MKRFKYLTLAALVAFAACDEGEDAPPQGTISGAVTIEGTGASGVTVSLSSGATTTTDGSGQYTFADVDAGSYTVTISGYPADATFTTTSQAAAITTADQVVTVNFSGTYVRTSAITGFVTAGGSPIQGVTVSIGSGTPTTQTDAGGQYSFSGLRAGSYTVTITGYDTNQYVFAQTSQSVQVAVGEAKVVSFSGMLATTAVIRGHMFVDENVKNDTFDSTEEALAVAGVTISLQLGLGTAITVETAADGSFEFTDLAAGDYQVTISANDPDIPANYALGAAASAVRTVTAGMTATVNFPFDIIAQTMRVGAFLGRDNGTAMVAPVKGVIIDLYPSQADLLASSNRLGRDTTEADGYTSFLFDREDDTAPGGGTDHIVYARYISAPVGPYVHNGEVDLEIAYSATSAIATGPDVYDFLYGAVTLGFNAEEIDGDPAPGWFAALRSNKDSTSATTASALTNASGVASYDMTLAASQAAGSDGVLPDTFWVRLSTTQAAANGHGWQSTLEADEGTAAGRYLRYIWDGTVAEGDTLTFGSEIVTYTDADIIYRAHHEADDSTGTTPTFTLGDDFTEVANVSVAIHNEAGDTVVRPAAALTPAGAPASLGAGSDRRYNLATGRNYRAVATSSWALLDVLSDTSVVFTLEGGNQVDTLDVLAGGAGASTFAYKLDNGTISGSVEARDGTGAQGLKVHVQAGPGNIQGEQDTTVVADATGAFTTNNNLREGPYTITVMDSTTANGPVWGFSVSLKTTSVPLSSGSADNADAHSGVRDLEGSNATTTANFLADRMDTRIQGVVGNDRDNDANTLDPNEALAGVTIELYRDNSGAPGTAVDSLVETTTTDAGGAFSFSQLMEGRYVVKAAGVPEGVPAQVLRRLTGGDTAVVHTAAAAPVFPNSDGGRTVGITTGFTAGAPLPRWDYNSSTMNLLNPVLLANSQPHFTFLFQNGTATGTITSGGNPVAGMTVSAVKCQTSAGSTSPPTAGTCTTQIAATAVNATTNASGVFTLENLSEGVWQITPSPATAGLTTATPANMLFQILGSQDVETGNFTAN